MSSAVAWGGTRSASPRRVSWLALEFRAAAASTVRACRFALPHTTLTVSLIVTRADVGLGSPAATIFLLSPAMGVTPQVRFQLSCFSLLMRIFVQPVDQKLGRDFSQHNASQTACPCVYESFCPHAHAYLAQIAKTTAMLRVLDILVFGMVLTKFELLRCVRGFVLALVAGADVPAGKLASSLYPS